MVAVESHREAFPFGYNPYYAAPEILLRAVGPQLPPSLRDAAAYKINGSGADVWSTGVLAFQTLIGSLPFALPIDETLFGYFLEGNPKRQQVKEGCIARLLEAWVSFLLAEDALGTACTALVLPCSPSTFRNQSRQHACRKTLVLHLLICGDYQLQCCFCAHS